MESDPFAEILRELQFVPAPPGPYRWVPDTQLPDGLKEMADALDRMGGFVPTHITSQIEPERPRA